MRRHTEGAGPALAQSVQRGSVRGRSRRLLDLLRERRLCREELKALEGRASPHEVIIPAVAAWEAESR